MITPEKFEKDIILTIKSCCFSELDLFLELKKCIEKINRVPCEYLESSSVLYWVEKVFIKYVPESLKANMFKELFKTKSSIVIEDVIAYMTMEIATIKVYNGDEKLIDLD